MPRRRVLCHLLAAIALLPGCGKSTPSTPTPTPSSPAQKAASSPLAFRAQELPFQYERGETGMAWPVETTGGGVGLLDYDGDGDLDLFFAQGMPLPIGKTPSPPADVLLENQGNGRFVDASTRASLTAKGYGQGVTVGDYDGDGDPDVYVTRYGPNTLWRNDGGSFVDATAEAGVGCPLWSLGAAFFDCDGDGDLDLYVANYLDFDPSAAPFERNPKTNAPEYGMPARFEGQPDVLYRNLGGGRFEDATKEFGLAEHGRGMGVLAADLDDDGRMDVLVANDAQANAFWSRPDAGGPFANVAETLGLAFNREGQPEANMGIALGDTDGNGLLDVLITHFFGEHDTLWRGLRPTGGGPVFFQDQTIDAGIAVHTRPLTGWGAAMADFDQDGALDMLVTCGHIRHEPSQTYPYENPPILWRNDGRGRFVDATAGAGPYFRERRIGRGLAVGDLDGDGDLDAVVVHHHAHSVVLWNETQAQGRSLTLALRGRPGGNTEAVGARVVATVGGRKLVRTVYGGGSYISAGDRRIHLGLGAAPAIDRLEIRWPSGRIETRTGVPNGGVLAVEEPE